MSRARFPNAPPEDTKGTTMGTIKEKRKPKTAAGLRRAAQEKLRAKKSRVALPRSRESAQKLVHELQVHQIELEMQNAELKQTRTELEASLDKYSELYDFAPVGYFTFDVQLRILEANLTGAKLLGVERRGLINKPFLSFISNTDSKEIFSNHCQTALQKKKVQTCEIQLTRKDGSEFWADLQSRPRENTEGKIDHLWTVIMDITSHKMAINRIEHLASFPQLNPNPIIETDLKGKVIYCNNASLKILQKLNAPDEGSIFLPPDFPEILRKLSKDNEGRYELREIKIGERTFIESIIAPADLKVVRIYIQNITRRKEAEKALQHAHDNLEERVEKRTGELKEALSEIEKMKERLEAENIYFRHEIKLKHQFEHILGQSDGLKYVLYRAQQVAPMDTTVLILGETGTGKELIASAIHEMSPRKEKPLITVNCAALPANLIESELFGREKGAFTGADVRRLGRFEIAHQSTICLDEIGELPLELQGKLLRVIQNNKFERLGSSNTISVDVRIIATTNRNLEEEVRQGRFRQDLYYRLNVFPITIPPLRHRKDDIPLLVDTFVERFSRKLGKKITSITDEAMKSLQDYPWPGNIRELESIIERAVILCAGQVLELPDKLETTSAVMSSALRTLEETEKSQILKILTETKWRIEGKDGAAEILGLHPSTLRARMRKLGLSRPQTTEPY
ncbi:MAG: sigma 54-interacting transcriptional regulator [Syntrophaceae bacterium]|nr:sigma 54-interacting transcriptional regulator [Syntrophaceae bacterium]